MTQKAGEMNAEKGSYSRILFGAQWEGDDWKLSVSASRQAQSEQLGLPGTGREQQFNVTVRLEQGADFRQPPGEPEPAAARCPLALGGLAFAGLDRHSERCYNRLRHVLDQLTTWHRPVCQRLHLAIGRSRPSSRLGYRVLLRGVITDVTPPTGGSQSAYEFKAQQESSPARP
ncbi:hypothetical protein [Streptomyces microflavus]|uniref:hypothetical protein n=1 Tax=Streptomyces microflavus TaxID=1919 RepID=UPI0033A39F0F